MVISCLVRPLKKVSKRFRGCRKLTVILVSVVIVVNALWIFRGSKGPDDRARMTPDNVVASNNTASYCGTPCEPGQFSYSITSGWVHQEKKVMSLPVICFQGEELMSETKGNVGRGINMAVIDSGTETVKHLKTFDTYISEFALVQFLKTNLTPTDIIMLATFDDAASQLRKPGRDYLNLFGSKLAKQLGFRENFVMIGHKGLEEGSAIETYSPTSLKSRFGAKVTANGCFSFPLNNTRDVASVFSYMVQAKDMKTGDRHDNCGMPQPCSPDHVAVAVDTGYGNWGRSKICVDGFVRMDNNINLAGPGFNMVALDPDTLKPSNLIHVDASGKDSTDLEIDLDELKNNTIIVGVISHKDSYGVDFMAQNILNMAGSGYMQNLRPRDLWYFVGQKGLGGFTKFEEMSYAPPDKGFAKSLNNQFCVPKKLPASANVADPVVFQNNERRNFCIQFEDFTDFCDPEYIDEYLQAVPVFAKELKGHAIFDTPLILVPGTNRNAFVKTLQTTIMQPGIKPELVCVFWDERLPEYKELAKLFGFSEYRLNSSATYSEQMTKAMKSANVAFPNASHVMVVEENLLLGPDFLPFMAHCMDVMAKDDSLVGASTWNFNGFENVSGKADSVYRVSDIPGLGFLLKIEVFTKLVQSLEKCCQKRAWLGWPLEIGDREMLVPDTSRVYRSPVFGADVSSDEIRGLFSKSRKTHLDTKPAAINTQVLQAKEYEAFLQSQILNAYVLQPSLIELCVAGKSPPPNLPTEAKGAVVIYYQQDNSADFKYLKRICLCFGLVSLEQDNPKNIHRGMLRFYYQGNNIFLIGTSSPYYRHVKDNLVFKDLDSFKS